MATMLAEPSRQAGDKPLVSPRVPSDNVGQLGLSEVVLDAAKKVYGKQGAAAAQLGKDEGNFSRDVKLGRINIAQLGALGTGFLAALGEELVGQYGALSDPKDRMRQVVSVMRELVHEIEQFIEAA